MIASFKHTGIQMCRYDWRLELQRLVLEHHVDVRVGCKWFACCWGAAAAQCCTLMHMCYACCWGAAVAQFFTHGDCVEVQFESDLCLLLTHLSACLLSLLHAVIRVQTSTSLADSVP